MVWTGFVPEMPCVHGHFNQSVYCTCDPGWGTEHVPVGVQLPVFCNESDVTYWKHQTTMKPRAHLAPSLIIMLVVTGALVALLLGLLGRRYIFPPPRNMDMGPLSDGQRECMERCRVYLGECRDRDPHSMEGDETDSDSGA
eukprot:gene8776-biopygen6139